MTVAVLMALDAPLLTTTPLFARLAWCMAEDFPLGACLLPEDLVYVGMREVGGPPCNDGSDPFIDVLT